MSVDRSPVAGLVRIRHLTTYHYWQPVQFGPHRLVVRPREGHDLRVEQLRLVISPAHTVVWSRDVFGNSIAHAYFSEAADELRIESEVVVRRFEDVVPRRPETAPMVSLPVPYDPFEQTLITAYLLPVYPEDTLAVQSWLRPEELQRSGGDADELILRLTMRIHGEIEYRRREERGVQSPATTLAMKSGSCRDVATLLMEASRILGIAARFASGYLDCAAARSGHGSTHAWAEVYFPNDGWRGFDPTTGRHCTGRHILTGVSHHPRGVMPVSGKYVGNSCATRGMLASVSFSGVEDAFTGESAQGEPREI